MVTRNLIHTFLVLIGLALGIAQDASSQTYYVDYESGADTNDGLATSRAWKHAPGDANAQGVPASLAQSGIQGGVTIKLKGGVRYPGYLCWGDRFYCNPLSPTPLGTSDSTRVTLSGDTWPGRESIPAIVDGSDSSVTPWKRCETADACGGHAQWQKIFYSEVVKPSHIRGSFAPVANAYQGDEPLAYAQLPDAKNRWYTDVSNFYSVPASEVTTTTIKDARLAAIGGKLVGATATLWLEGNKTERHNILAFDAETNTITLDPFVPYSDRPTLYAIENVLDALVLSKEGEYVIENTARPNGLYRMYVWPLGNENLAMTQSVTTSQRFGGFNLWSGQYVTVEGLLIRRISGDSYGGGAGSGISKASSGTAKGMIIRRNHITQSRSTVGAAFIGLSTTEGALIEHNKVSFSGGNKGIVVGGPGTIIQYNTIESVGGTGIYAPGCVNCRIIGNKVLNGNGVHANGISTYGTFPSSFCDTILIADNIVTDSNLAFTVEACRNVTLVNNIFLRSGLACWGGCENMTLSNNLIDGGSATLWTKSALRNNIFVGGVPPAEILESNLSLAGGPTCGAASCPNPAPDWSTLFVNAPRMRDFSRQNYSLPSPYNQSKIYISPTFIPNIKVGDVLIFEYDGIKRTVQSARRTIVSNDLGEVTFSPPVSEVKDGALQIWPAGTTDFSLDWRPRVGSSLIDKGVEAVPASVKSLFPGFDFNHDLDGQERIQGKGIDIGPYEWPTLEADWPRAPRNIIIGSK